MTWSTLWNSVEGRQFLPLQRIFSARSACEVKWSMWNKSTWDEEETFLPIFMKHQHTHPNSKQHSARHFTCPKRPTNVRHVVKEDVRERWIAFRVRHSFMNHNHHKCGDPCHQECVACKMSRRTENMSQTDGIYVIRLHLLLSFSSFLSIFMFGSFSFFKKAFIFISTSRMRFRELATFADDAVESQPGND